MAEQMEYVLQFFSKMPTIWDRSDFSIVLFCDLESHRQILIEMGQTLLRLWNIPICSFLLRYRNQLGRNLNLNLTSPNPHWRLKTRQVLNPGYISSASLIDMGMDPDADMQMQSCFSWVVHWNLEKFCYLLHFDFVFSFEIGRLSGFDFYRRLTEGQINITLKMLEKLLKCSVFLGAK